MRFLILYFFSMSIYAQTISLQESLDTIKKLHPKFLSFKQEAMALKTKLDVDYARDFSTISFSKSKLNPDGLDSGFEYSGELSIPIDLANTRVLSLKSGENLLQAKLLQKQLSLIEFVNKLSNLYHKACVQKDKVDMITQILSQYQKIYEKKQSAYKFHEISKRELLQLEIEKNLLKQKKEAFLQKQISTKQHFLTLANLPKDTQLSCHDTLPIVKITPNTNNFLITQKIFEYQKRALELKYQRYDTFSDPVNLNIGYDKEVDAKRYAVGVQIPLTFTSTKKQSQKILSLQELKLLKLQYKTKLLEKDSKKSSLLSELNSNFLQVKAYNQNLQKFQKELLPLIQKAYNLGENSLLEYLFYQQKIFTLSLELIEQKQNYYQNLFDLQTILEKEAL